MHKIQRFSELLGSIQWPTPRILSIRLKELEREGYIRRIDERHRPKLVRWELTDKGIDTVPILMQFLAFGSGWYAERVFEDQMPRSLKEVYPLWEPDALRRQVQN